METTKPAKEVSRTGICQLCKKRSPLVHSHIFPEFFYKYIYRENSPPKFITMSTDSNKRIQLRQKGLREYLMCCDCDGQIIGRHERYVANWLNINSECIPQDCGDTILLANMSYHHFRLFHLSLLWRFHVATIDGFKHFQIPDYAETIREMLLADDPGHQYFFPCILLRPHEIFETLAGGLFCPIISKQNPFPICRASAAGLYWLWIMTDDAMNHPLSKASIDPAGQMRIIKGTPEITKLIKKELVEMNKAAAKAPNADKLKRWGFE